MSIIFNNVRIVKDGMFFPSQKVLIENGEITMVGSSIHKNADQVIECNQKYLVPGLIDAHSHIGLADSNYPTDDSSEEYCDFTPQLRPLDGIKMRDKALDDARRAGITTCLVCPASDLPIAGICSILKTNGNSADVGLIVEQAGVLASFGELPKQNGRMNHTSTATRMGIAASIREILMKAQDYAAAKKSKKSSIDRNIEMEALIPLIEGEVPLRACAHRVEDILAAIRIAEEFQLSIVIEYGTEAHIIADILSEKNIPVVLGPTLIPRLRYELNEKTFESAKILMDAGVKVALTCDYPGLPVETLRVAAAMAVQYGLDERRALASITSIPAEILGLKDRIGKISKGFDGDLALFSGHPLDIRSRMEALVVNGDLFVYSNDLKVEQG